MAIVFFCQSCGARFEIDPNWAGRRGRCKQCGHAVTIPRAEELPAPAERHAAATWSASSASGAGAAAGVGVGARGAGVVGGGASMAVAARAGAAAGAAGNRRPGQAPSIVGWLHSDHPDATLVPLPSEPAARPARPSPLDDDANDDADARPYALAGAEMRPLGPAAPHEHPALRAWRRALGRARRPFRFINESAYLVSTPFLMLLLVGGALRSRPMAVLGASVVVLLNLARIAAGSVDLVLASLRDGANLDKLKRPLGRVAGPVLTIGLVVLAFALVPWLSNGQPARASARGPRRGARAELGAAPRAARPTARNKDGRSQ